MADTISDGEPPADPPSLPPVATRRVLFVSRMAAQTRAHGSSWAAVALLIACSFWLGSRLGDSLPFSDGPGVHLTTWAPSPVVQAPPHHPTPDPSPTLAHSEATPALRKPASTNATAGGVPTRVQPTTVTTQPVAGADNTLDINSAGVEDLHRVLGVRRSTAQRIVLYRQHHGPFASLDDLLAVPLSRSTIERIGARIVFR
jgi:competence ComEA-like helix-hairpin-helix protein